MIGAVRRALRTLQLICYALLPSRGGKADPTAAGEVRRCEPHEILGGMGLFLDNRGELRLFFPECRPLAAPLILFRLKREGFSRCSVQVRERGLLVQGRR